MKRRNVIRNIAAGSLLVSGVGSAAAVTRENGSTTYKLREVGDTFEVVETFDGGVGIEHHYPDDCDAGCCKERCCDCSSGCGICYCHHYCDDPVVE